MTTDTILEASQDSESSGATGRVDRRLFVADLMARVPAETLVVTGLGSPSYDVFAAGHRERNFHLWGAMGGAVSLGLGLALAQPSVPVIVITGDGEQLMGIGSLATVAVKSPNNLTIVILDNGHFGETGMQASHSSLGTDLAAVALGFGIPAAYRVTEREGVDAVISSVASGTSATFAQVLINTGEPPRALPPRDGVANKNAFRSALGHETF